MAATQHDHLRRIRPQIEHLEDRTTPATYRTIDGTGNNLSHPEWGSTGENLLRRAPAAYADGISAPGGTNRPSPRAISNAVVAEEEEVISDRFLSAMIYAFGQFIDHDLDLTPNAGSRAARRSRPGRRPVLRPDRDRHPGDLPSPGRHSTPPPAPARNNPRQQVNVVTAFLDGSVVYGSDAVTAAKLRTFAGGRLKMDRRRSAAVQQLANFPTGVLPMDNDAHRVPDDQLFAAGDVRANENIELTSLHTLFVREHNRLAAANPGGQPGPERRGDLPAGPRPRRRRVTGRSPTTSGCRRCSGRGRCGRTRATSQRSTPASPTSSPPPSSASATACSATTSSSSTTTARRSPRRSRSPRASSTRPLVDNGIEPILKYLVSDPSREIDNVIVNSVRNFLFGPPGAGGFDLASLNIQRGRDHGLADYNDVRAAYGLPRVTSFGQITSDAELQDRLRQLYGNVNNIDLWVGALAEDHVPGSSVGPLIRRIIADQFERVRDGDRFWYQRQFSGIDSVLVGIANAQQSDRPQHRHHQLARQLVSVPPLGEWGVVQRPGSGRPAR